MITQRIRIDLPAAKNNNDGTITARAFPLGISPNFTNLYTAFQISRVEINPSTAVVELQFRHANGHTDIFSSFGGGMTALGDVIEHEQMTLVMFNLSTDSGVTVSVWIDQYTYAETVTNG